MGLIDIVNKSRATLEGAGIVIEKASRKAERRSVIWVSASSLWQSWIP